MAKDSEVVNSENRLNQRQEHEGYKNYAVTTGATSLVLRVKVGKPSV